MGVRTSEGRQTTPVITFLWLGHRSRVRWAMASSRGLRVSSVQVWKDGGVWFGVLGVIAAVVLIVMGNVVELGVVLAQGQGAGGERLDWGAAEKVFAELGGTILG